MGIRFASTGLAQRHLTLQPVEQPGFTTVSTDGRHLYFCPGYSVRLTDTERRFWHAHLIWHCVAGHLYSPLGVHAHRWRLAGFTLAHVDAYEGVNLVSLCLDQLSICHVLLHLDRQGRKGTGAGLPASTQWSKVLRLFYEFRILRIQVL